MFPVADPVVMLWEEWQRTATEADALSSQWSDAEQALSRSIGWNAMEVAVTANAAGTQDMNAIAERQDALDQLLDDLGRRILALPSQSLAGAIAKLSLAFAVADPTQRDELEWRLVQNALNELRRSTPL